MTDTNNDTHWLVVDSNLPIPNLIGQMIENGGDMSDSLKEVHVTEYQGDLPEKRSAMQRLKEFLFGGTLMKPVDGSPFLVGRKVGGSSVTVNLQTGQVKVSPPGPSLRFDFVVENLNRRSA